LDLSVNSITSLSNEKVELFYTLNGNTAFASLSIGGIYNVYNFSSAVLALSVLGINNVDSVCTFGGAFGRMEKFKCSNKEITLLLVKNPVGLSQCLSYVQKINGNFDLILSLNDKDADGRDVSWIWDASFAGIRDKCNNVYTLGTRGLDMAVRLKYDSIKVDKIIHGENYNQMIDVITNSKNNVVILSTYTSMMSMRHCLINKFGGAEFWQ
jgi:UDP-N-acetylmuramyl tripeptide synthase